ncbi:hypothetical protein [Mobiluncus massiliensis]|uniref:hypothetical protein n=1 Tax=uncultured Mobiluncus sp. TaxID=293425 RepID=UPI0024AE1D21|nr:hypothetical protein [Mobiluncus sp. Marseille-Q7826]
MEISYEETAVSNEFPTRNALIGLFLGAVTLGAQTYLVMKSPAMAEMLMTGWGGYSVAYGALDLLRCLVVCAYALYLLRARMNPDSERPFVVVAAFTAIIPWAGLQAYILILAIQSGGFTPFDFLWGALLASIAGAGLALGLIRPK